jgi:hypothetical protein
MTPHPSFFGQAPESEQLSAYVDGELDEPARQAIESWLAGHPEAAAEVDAHRRLRGLWQEGAPPGIDPAAAHELLCRIEQALRNRASRSARRRRAALAFAAAGMAAAVLLVVWVKRPAETNGPAADQSVAVQVAPEPFQIVGPEDVQILHYRKHPDAEIVGVEPFLGQPLSLATSRDVSLIHVTADDGGNIPVLARDPDPNAPALLRPFELVRFSFP